jgi:outer membrane immunogenic protein
MTRKIRSVALTRNLLAGIAVIMLAAASAASAADISAQRAPMPMAFVAPPFSWTGFYVGANVGGGWASSTLSDSFTGVSLGNSTSGFVGGGQLGYNYQIGNFVVGPEWTFEGASLKWYGEHQLDDDDRGPFWSGGEQLAVLRQGRRGLDQQ